MIQTIDWTKKNHTVNLAFRLNHKNEKDTLMQIRCFAEENNMLFGTALKHILKEFVSEYYENGPGSLSQPRHSVSRTK